MVCGRLQALASLEGEHVFGVSGYLSESLPVSLVLVLRRVSLGLLFDVGSVSLDMSRN